MTNFIMYNSNRCVGGILCVFWLKTMFLRVIDLAWQFILAENV